MSAQLAMNDLLLESRASESLRIVRGLAEGRYRRDPNHQGWPVFRVHPYNPQTHNQRNNEATE